MELNSASMTAFKTLYDATFNNAFNLYKPEYPKASYVFNSGRVEVVRHRWMRSFAGMREFIGARVVNNIGSDGFDVANRKWEDTIGIQRVDLERDQWGVYTPIIARMGQIAHLHRDQLVFGLMSDCLTGSSTIISTLAYDGQQFYGNHTSNRVTAAAFNNKLSGAGSALSEGSLTNALQNLKLRTDTQGNILAATQSKPLLIVPPSLEFTGRKLLHNAYYPSTAPGSGDSTATNQMAASENVLSGAADLLVSPYLKTQTEWHLTLTDVLFKPIIFQIEQEIEMLAWDKFLARYADYDEYTWGVRALYAVAPGLPEMCTGSVGV